MAETVGDATIYRPPTTGRILNYELPIPVACSPDDGGDDADDLQRLHGHKTLFTSHGIRELINDVSFLTDKGASGNVVRSVFVALLFRLFGLSPDIYSQSTGSAGLLCSDCALLPGAGALARAVCGVCLGGTAARADGLVHACTDLSGTILFNKIIQSSYSYK